MVTIYLTSKFWWYHELSITWDSYQYLDPAEEENKTLLLLYLHDDDYAMIEVN